MSHSAARYPSLPWVMAIVQAYRDPMVIVSPSIEGDSMPDRPLQRSCGAGRRRHARRGPRHRAHAGGRGRHRLLHRTQRAGPSRDARAPGNSGGNGRSWSRPREAGASPSAPTTTIEAEVERLLARVRAEAGRLDVLVNDIWGGDALTEWGSPFWELSTAKGLELLERAVHTHIITSRHGAPLMIERDAGLIVEVTDGDTFGYRGNLFYDLAKNAVARLAYAMAGDLRAHNVTALAVTPGFLRSEAVLDHFGVTEANWRDAIEKDEYFAESETPCFVGRAIAALAADLDVAKKSGGLFSSWGLAKEYGFTDIDGRRPDWGSFFLRKVQGIVNRDAPPDEMDLFVVRSRLYQAELDPSAAGEAERLRAWLEPHE